MSNVWGQRRTGLPSKDICVSPRRMPVAGAALACEDLTDGCDARRWLKPDRDKSRSFDAAVHAGDTCAYLSVSRSGDARTSDVRAQYRGRLLVARPARPLLRPAAPSTATAIATPLRRPCCSTERIFATQHAEDGAHRVGRHSVLLGERCLKLRVIRCLFGDTLLQIRQTEHHAAHGEHNQHLRIGQNRPRAHARPLLEVNGRCHWECHDGVRGR